MFSLDQTEPGKEDTDKKDTLEFQLINIGGKMESESHPLATTRIIIVLGKDH